MVGGALAKWRSELNRKEMIMQRQKLERGGTLMSGCYVAWELGPARWTVYPDAAPPAQPPRTDFKFLACRRARGYVYVDCTVKFVVSKSNGLRNCPGHDGVPLGHM